MLDDIVKVKLIFENCESATIESKYIASILIDGIEYTIRKSGYNSINKFAACKFFSISFMPEANIYADLNLFAEEISFFDRVSIYNDITGIVLFYENGKREEIYAPWRDYLEEPTVNDCQNSFIDDKDNLCVVIKE